MDSFSEQHLAGLARWTQQLFPAAFVGGHMARLIRINNQLSGVATTVPIPVLQQQGSGKNGHHTPPAPLVPAGHVTTVRNVSHKTERLFHQTINNIHQPATPAITHGNTGFRTGITTNTSYRNNTGDMLSFSAAGNLLRREKETAGIPLLRYIPSGNTAAIAPVGRRHSGPEKISQPLPAVLNTPITINENRSKIAGTLQAGIINKTQQPFGRSREEWTAGKAAGKITGLYAGKIQDDRMLMHEPGKNNTAASQFPSVPQALRWRETLISENIPESKRAENINSGGQRDIVINIGKQIESLAIHTTTPQQGVEDIGNLIREEMRRVLFSLNAMPY